MITVYSPETLAERWSCSDNHVRNLIKQKQLRAFRIGRLIRITADAVMEHEQCQPSTGSGDSKADTSSHGGSTESDHVIVLTHVPERKPKPKPST